MIQKATEQVMERVQKDLAPLLAQKVVTLEKVIV
jgi:hypothetical protein